MSSFYTKVYDAVRKVPHGKVSTYGQIAAMCGSPKAARVVGYALHVNPFPGEIPCHRIVNRHGGLAPAFAFGGKDAQKQLLLAEGVAVDDAYCVPLHEFFWKKD